MGGGFLDGRDDVALDDPGEKTVVSPHHADAVERAEEVLLRGLQGLFSGTKEVYGTLDFLVKNGILTLIQGRSFKDENGGYYARSYYDRRIDPHINMLCVSCGRIEDLDEIPLDNMLKELNLNKSWELVQQTIGLQGICEQCNQK